MAVRLHCDRCGSFVQAIPDPKDLAVFKKEIICKRCANMEDGLAKFAESLRNKWSTQMQIIIEEAKKELKSSLEGLKDA